MTATAFLAFGREADNDDGICGPWWPLFMEDGPHMAESAGACYDLICERLALSGETGTWGEIAIVAADAWTERRVA